MSIPYSQSFKVVKSACQANIEFMDTVLNRLQNFVATNTSFLKTLQKIKLEIPSKRGGGFKSFTSSLFKGVKGPLEFPNAEKTFADNLMQISDRVLSNPPGLELEMQLLGDLFAPSLRKVTNEYKQETTKFINKGDSVEQKHQKLDSDYKRGIQKRDQLITQIAQLKKKNSDDPSVSQKLTELNSQLQLQEKSLEEMAVKVNESQTNYARVMENVLTLFESQDRQFTENINNCFTEFSNSFANIKEQKDSTVSFMGTLFEKDVIEREMNEIINTSKASPVTPITLQPVIKPLSFPAALALSNTTNGVPFQGESNKSFGRATSDYDKNSPDELSVKKDDVFLIHEIKSKALIQLGEKVGYVPPQIIQMIDCSSTKPHLASATDNFHEGQVFVRKGECVYVRSVIDGKTNIVTESYQEASVPTSIVQ